MSLRAPIKASTLARHSPRQVPRHSPQRTRRAQRDDKGRDKAEERQQPRHSPRRTRRAQRKTKGRGEDRREATAKSICRRGRGERREESKERPGAEEEQRQEPRSSMRSRKALRNPREGLDPTRMTATAKSIHRRGRGERRGEPRGGSEAKKGNHSRQSPQRKARKDG